MEAIHYVSSKSSHAIDLLLKEIVANWGKIETSFLESSFVVVDTLFAPRQVFRQLIVAWMIQGSIMSTRGLYSMCYSMIQRLTPKGRELRRVEEGMANAKSYDEWKALADEHDSITGQQFWRNDSKRCSLFNVRVIKRRIEDMRRMRQSGDIFQLMFRMRSGMARDQYGTLNNQLYSIARGGTKKIIEEYHETVCSALHAICDDDEHGDEIPTDAKLAFFNETRHSYGRTALLLSGGAAMGYYHMGLVRTLYMQGLLPRVISGASAGSIMAAIIGTCTDEELAELMDISDPTVSRFRTDFFSFPWDIKESRPNKLFQYFLPENMRWVGKLLIDTVFNRYSILKLDTDHLMEVMKENIGFWTFQEAFDRTGRIINVTVTPQNSYDPPRLLNYLTAPHVCVWSAAVASCAIPGMFDSVDLMVKEPNGDFRPENEWSRELNCDATPSSITPDSRSGSSKSAPPSSASYTDGSVEADLPMQQLSELFNVNHFIISQVS